MTNKIKHEPPVKLNKAIALVIVALFALDGYLAHLQKETYSHDYPFGLDYSQIESDLSKRLRDSVGVTQALNRAAGDDEPAPAPSGWETRCFRDARNVERCTYRDWSKSETVFRGRESSASVQR